MRTFVFDNDFERDYVLQFISELEDCKEKEITIYFNSTGGTVSYAELLTDYINKTSKKRKYTLIAYYFIESCAFDFFVKTKCYKKIVLDACHIVVHLSKPTIEGKLVSKKQRASYKDKSTQEFFSFIDKSNREYLIFYKNLEIPEDLMKIIEKGGDAVIPVELMREIIKNI